VLRLRLGPEAAGLRLDRALADRLPEHSRTVLAAWIREGRVRVDGAVVPGRTRTGGGEAVTIEVPVPRPTTVEPEDVPLAILYEDEHLLAVDKPAGLTVHPGSGRQAGTLANALVHYIRGLPEAIGSDRPGIVHRLDKDTSGVLVVAKSDRVQRALSALFAGRAVDKTYAACVHGHPDADAGVIELRLGRSKTNRKKMAVQEAGGREAVTRWEVKRRLPRHTLLHCHPETGRTHQIRVHLKALHLPIVGDPIYGRRSGAGEDRVERMLLHALRLAFRHPVTGEAVAFEAPLPPAFEGALDALAALEPPRRRRG
jgi:23S rRNA pseudouridine1911/1915/1917 synthase